ncbi:NUDIX domain-containing protein [Cellulomonas marina]|uniref:ADP-ribose pyrophosphatase n=1 Tax=Cellulomonas marina TaxID=988821 RepID=A0A1I0ZTL4_9CELL|nr:NUDIX hydrolase [Cellulomonas marina]GIG28783.1 NUDIX hydrolase [Cellulomonas marina]SFB28702.1 ADP-ribose pyrophosphatase [Cellulomonas marina]
MSAADTAVPADAGTADRPSERPVVEHRTVHAGRIFDLVADVVDLGDTQVTREYLAHPGAVAVVVLDDDDRVLLLDQYRHAVRQELWEPPAGLLDVAGEDPVAAAARELAEEADLRAASWWRLTEIFSTPGSSSERIQLFLARDLSPVPEAERYARVDEEATMRPVWVPLDEAVAGVLAGRLRCPTTVVGVLAAAAARAGGWTDLRPVRLSA